MMLALCAKSETRFLGRRCGSRIEPADSIVSVLFSLAIETLKLAIAQRADTYYWYGRKPLDDAKIRISIATCPALAAENVECGGIVQRYSAV